jgi:hypothetical protein
VLPERLQAPTFGYLAALDEKLPGVVSALYVVGSSALGDFSERVSNIDVVTVSDEPWSEDALSVAAAEHDGLKRARPAVVAYVTSSDLGDDPRSLDRPCYEGSTRVASDRLVNPLTWHILAGGAVDLRGPDHIGLWDRADVLQGWAAGQLRTVWAPRLAHLDRLGSMWFRHDVSGTVLEVGRLAVAVTSGAALSKTEAARRLEPDVPGRFRRILADSVGYRYGGRTSMYWGPLERKQHAMELLHQLVSPSTDGATHAA